MRTIALLRCSTDHQDLDHQRHAATAWARANGADLEVVEERAVSGAAARRPGLDELLSRCRRGGVAVVWVLELSRLGRSQVQVLQVTQELDRLGVRLVVQNLGLDTATPSGRLVLGVMAALAEFERESIRERVRSGITAAKARGVTFGRPRLQWTDEELEELRALRAAGHSFRAIREGGMLKVFRRTGSGDEIPVVPSEGSMRAALAARRAG